MAGPTPLRIDSVLAQAGRSHDEPTGAISCPIYQTAAFRHAALGESTGFDYSRSANPTRSALEGVVAEIEGGARAFAFASGMAGLTATLMLFKPGDHLIVSEDLYGGTYRLLETVFGGYGLAVSYVDTTNLAVVEKTLTEHTKGLLVETPSNPMMRISDLSALAHLAKRRGLLAIADNTFMTPYLQRPLRLGWDVVVHSATKFLGGHNDVVAGLVVAREPDLAERIAFVQNAAGAVLGPQDSWLIMRGLKTLALRLERQQTNAAAVTAWLCLQPAVGRVFYPGLRDHPGYATHALQADGTGGVISFEVLDPGRVERILGRVRLISFAESLGGVESLITFPARQTHVDIPREVRDRLGVTDRLLRLSLGVEAAEDLIADLEQAIG